MTGTTYLALYHGASLQEARLVSVSTDGDLISGVAAKLLEKESGKPSGNDPISTKLSEARREALRLIAGADSQNRPVRRCRHE